MKFIPLFLVMIFLSSCHTKQSETESQLNEIKLANVKYGSYERNIMDVYLPKGRNKKIPFVINIHGGAWTLGDKVWGAGISEYFYHHNVAVVNMNYRFADDNATHLPELLNDINNVVKYIQQHSEEWNVRNNGYSITGESAGAHMALSYAYQYPQNIKAIMTRCAPTNFGDIENLKNAQKNDLIGAINKMSGNKEEVDIAKKIPEKYINVSPVNHVKNIPTLIFHGDQDELVPYSQATQLSKLLDQKKYNHLLITLPGASHNILLRDNDRDLIYLKSLEWVEKYGR